MHWAKEATVLNDSSVISGNGIASDNIGNSYLTGDFSDTIQFGTQTITTPSTSVIYAYLTKYDSNGNVKWARQSTGNTVYGVTSFSVASDRYGNSTIGGYFEDSADFDSYKLGSRILSGTLGDMFIAKYDSNGNVLWAKQGIITSTSDGCQVIALTTDKSGNIYVAGDFDGTVKLGIYTIIGTISNNFFVAKYDTGGNVLWVKHSTGLDNNDYGTEKISIDNYNHVYLSVAGGSPGTICKIAFGGDTLTKDDTAEYDGVSLIFKLDSNGTVLCSSIMRGGAFNNCIASDTSGNYVYFAGTSTTEMIFGEDTVNPFNYPVNPNVSGAYNGFPIVARWQGCDSNIVTNLIPQKNIAEEVKVYPNPNNGIFTVALSHAELVSASQTIMEVYNVLGEQVYTFTLPPPFGGGASFSYPMNLSSQPNGIYFYRVLNENESLVGSGKIVIER
jgi:Secretion system C-terminal sorting domain